MLFWLTLPQSCKRWGGQGGEGDKHPVETRASRRQGGSPKARIHACRESATGSIHQRGSTSKPQESCLLLTCGAWVVHPPAGPAAGGPKCACRMRGGPLPATTRPTLHNPSSKRSLRTRTHTTSAPARLLDCRLTIHHPKENFFPYPRVNLAPTRLLDCHSPYTANEMEYSPLPYSTSPLLACWTAATPPSRTPKPQKARMRSSTMAAFRVKRPPLAMVCGEWRAR